MSNGARSSWRVAEIKEGRGVERVGRHAGVSVVSAGRHGSGHGREHVKVELHSLCGGQFGWVA